MKTLIILEIILMLVTGSCNKEMNTIAPDQTFELKYGETKIKADYGLSIRLDSVLNDSRCPSKAVCVWAGNVEVRFVYLKDNNSVKFILNTLPSFRTDTLINGYRIKLINLFPYPEIAGIINQEDYKAEVRITKE